MDLTPNIKGSTKAHILRRFFHVFMLALPFLYYQFAVPITTKKVLHLLLLAFIFLVFLLEKLRIRYRLVVFGQRSYEAMQISAFGWTMLSLAVVFMFAPSAAYAIAIVAACAFVDPLMGELRLRKIKSSGIAMSGWLMGLLTWGLCAYVYHLSFWWVLVMPPLTVLLEWPKLKWIDDNALMLLGPLFLILLLNI